MTQENSRPLGEAPIQLATSREVAEERLQQQIARGEEIITRQPRSPQSARGLIQDSKSWARFTSELLSHLFSTAEYRSEFDDERTAALMYGSGETPQEEVRIAIDATEEQLNSLRTIRQRVELLDAFPLANVVTRKTTPSANAVFVVHGRDESAKHSIARFLEQIGLSPIILHEQPDKGRTIIQKFEDHTDVVFAVVLLTPDDEGRLWGSSGGLSLRARQNVILELGYFIGKLGRARVCALKGDGVEEPSDLHGVLYIPLDSGDAWRLTLARELKAAGLNVDMNKVV